MSFVWNNKKCTARDITNHLNTEREIAYNTVQTIMTRLVEKGLLKRELEGKTHMYQTLYKKKNILSSIVNKTMSGFVSQFGEDALIAFVDGLDDISDETRNKLIKKLQKK